MGWIWAYDMVAFSLMIIMTYRLFTNNLPKYVQKPQAPYLYTISSTCNIEKWSRAGQGMVQSSATRISLSKHLRNSTIFIVANSMQHRYTDMIWTS